MIKIYTINCKYKKRNLSFNLEEIKNVKIPLNSEEKKLCPNHSNLPFTYYDKTTKSPLCDKCIENDEFKDHEKIKISDIKSNIKENISDIEYKTYDEFKKYLNGYLEQFIEKCNEYYQN